MSKFQLRVLAFGLLAGALGGCSGPKLYLENAQITAIDRAAGTLSWRADVTNSSSGTGPFCKRTAAAGWIKMQAWLTKSTDLDDLPRIPAGGTMVVLEGDSLAVGATRSGGLTGVPLPPSTDLIGYTHLIIEAYTKAAASEFGLPGNTNKNTRCKRHAVRFPIPLP